MHSRTEPAQSRRATLAWVASATVSALATWPVLASAQGEGAMAAYFQAIELNLPRDVEAALKRGVDPNATDARGNPGLFLALRVEAAAVAEVLWAQPGLQADQANAHGETALMMAALRGRRDWVDRLLARGAALNREGWTPLHYAASGPSLEVLELLLQRGAALDAVSPTGATALMMAARFGSLDAARALLARGANVRHRDAQGRGAAEFARIAGRDALAQEFEARQR
jgi:uncharacterized protein